MPVGSSVRIYDLARELRQDTKRVIEELRREGADVSVPSQSISEELADKIRNKYFPKTAIASKQSFNAVRKASSVKIEKLIEQQVQMTEIELLELRTKKYVKQIKPTGFDSKCEDCGNYYASDYIKFHKKERCLKKPFNSDNLPDFQQPSKKMKKESNIELVDLPILENDLLTIPQNQNIINDVLKGIRQKHKHLLRCPHCNVNVKSKGLEKHFSKCPALKSKINIQENPPQKNKKNSDFGEKLSDCQYCSLKLKTKNLQKHISTFHPSASFKPQKAKRIGGIIVCSNCKARYSNLALKCPQCDSYRTKIKTLSPISKLFKCWQCGHPAMHATSVCQSCGDK